MLCAGFCRRGPRDLTAATACHAAAGRLREIFIGVRGGLDEFFADGPRRDAQFAMLAADVRGLCIESAMPSTA